jgi:hypothetical protein
VAIEQAAGFIAQILKRQPRGGSSIRDSRPTEVFRALARLPWASNHVPVIFKIFDVRYQATAIFNELIGFHIAAFLGLPIPRDVRFCPARANAIIGPSRCLSGRDRDSEWIRGVAAVDETPWGVVQIWNRQHSQLVAAELRAWRYLAQTAVFDELIMNVDRNLYNFYRRRPHDFVLIDHAEAFGGQGWTLSQVRDRLRKPSTNYAAIFIAESTELSTQNEMMREASRFAREIRISEKSLGLTYAALDNFSQVPRGTSEEIVAFLNARMPLLPELLFHHLKASQLLLH